MVQKFEILILLFLLAGYFPRQAKEVFQTTTARVEFFSSAPVEDISAVSNEGISVLRNTGEISFLVNIKSLKFPKSRMQEHFNENFMESDKFPTASFKGKINKPPNFSLPGEYSITLRGTLEIHGVKQTREIPAVLSIDNGNINLKSQFEVACEAHNIKIPRILWKNIAEIVQVQVNANYK